MMGAVVVCVAIEKEQAVAGYINRHGDGVAFTVDDVNKYVLSLWNAGCGPIRLNYTQQELRDYLDCCEGVCLLNTPQGYVIDKSGLHIDMTEEEREFLYDNVELATSFALFCKLQVDMRTPEGLLDAMGFRFMYA